jgi:hypothetical protein
LSGPLEGKGGGGGRSALNERNNGCRWKFPAAHHELRRLMLPPVRYRRQSLYMLRPCAAARPDRSGFVRTREGTLPPGRRNTHASSRLHSNACFPGGTQNDLYRSGNFEKDDANGPEAEERPCRAHTPKRLHGGHNVRVCLRYNHHSGRTSWSYVPDCQHRAKYESPFDNCRGLLL